MLVGRNLKKFREQRNFTKIALAKKAGVDKNTIVRIEQDRGNTSLNTITKLAEALEVSLEQLITSKMIAGTDYVVFKPQPTESNKISRI